MQTQRRPGSWKRWSRRCPCLRTKPHARPRARPFARMPAKLCHRRCLPRGRTWCSFLGQRAHPGTSSAPQRLSSPWSLPRRLQSRLGSVANHPPSLRSLATARRTLRTPTTTRRNRRLKPNRIPGLHRRPSSLAGRPVRSLPKSIQATRTPATRSRRGHRPIPGLPTRRRRRSRQSQRCSPVLPLRRMRRRRRMMRKRAPGGRKRRHTTAARPD